MDREELRAALDGLKERQNRENRENAETLYRIQKERDTLVWVANDSMKKRVMQENIRHKEAAIGIERERQQLFADYKAAMAESRQDKV